MTAVYWLSEMDDDCFQTVVWVVVALLSLLLLALRFLLLGLETVQERSHVTSTVEEPFDSIWYTAILNITSKFTFFIKAILAWRSSNPIYWICRIEFSSIWGDWEEPCFYYSKGASMLLSKLSMIQLIAASMLSLVAVNALILAFLE